MLALMENHVDFDKRKHFGRLFCLCVFGCVLLLFFILDVVWVCCDVVGLGFQASLRFNDQFDLKKLESGGKRLEPGPVHFR